jgi:two-component system OmpR family response regulator
LLKRAWPDAIDNPRTIDTHVLSLRKKIEFDPRQPAFIQTVRNVGYRFNVPPAQAFTAEDYTTANLPVALSSS